MFFFTNRGIATVYTFQLPTFHPNKTVSKKKSRKCKKYCIKNFLFLYYIQAKCGSIADKNPNAADDDERTFNYSLSLSSLLVFRQLNGKCPSTQIYLNKFKR